MKMVIHGSCAKQKHPVQYVFVGLPKFQAFSGISGHGDITEDWFFDWKTARHLFFSFEHVKLVDQIGYFG